MNITIGTDPELFLMDKQGLMVSAHDLIPGTKFSPYKVQAGALQPDGVSAEFNTMPADSEDMFVGVIAHVMKQMEDFVHQKRPDLSISIQPTAWFQESYFETLPEIATALGCTPDFNAWTGKQNTPPETSQPFRTGSGHIHIGGWASNQSVSGEHFERCRDMVKQLDCVLYPASLLWDSDDMRRTLYGKIGAFRPKPYGVEYRPMSNAYLRNENIQRYVFRAARFCASALLEQNTKYFEDDYCLTMIERFRADSHVGEQEIKDYLKYMHTWYGVPKYEA